VTAGAAGEESTLASGGDVPLRCGVERARGFWIERGERVARARLEAQAPHNRKLLVQDLLLPWLDRTSAT
jgi:hypothetical protein